MGKNWKNIDWTETGENINEKWQKRTSVPQELTSTKKRKVIHCTLCATIISMIIRLIAIHTCHVKWIIPIEKGDVKPCFIFVNFSTDVTNMKFGLKLPFSWSNILLLQASSVMMYFVLSVVLNARRERYPTFFSLKKSQKVCLIYVS